MHTGSSPALAGRVFWALVAGFLAGVMLRSFFPIGRAYALFLLLLAVSAACLSFERKLRERATVLFLLCAALAFGVLRMDAATLSGDPMLSAHLGGQVTIEGGVSAEPDVRDSSVRVHIETEKIVSPDRMHVQAGILAVLPAHADVHYGEMVRAWGKLEAPKAFDTGSGRQFDYPEYLASQGITYELSLAQAEELQGVGDGGNLLQKSAIFIKQTFLRGLAAALPEPEAGLAGGITVGDKRSIGAELSGVFQHVGLIHIVVLSGYNITVVVNAAARLLLSAPRIAQFGASGFIVTLFILMAGGAASATRAGIMALVVVLARMSGRTFVAARALGLASLLIVLWNPWELVFDPGFQLSALATLGLIVFSPLLSPHLARIPEKYALREIVSSTLSTQLAVLPLLLYQNGLLPIYALPANLLALVVMPWAMFFSLVAGLAGIALGPFAAPLALPAYALLSYCIHIAQIFAGLPYASVALPAFSPAWMWAAYAILFLCFYLWHQKKSGRA